MTEVFLSPKVNLDADQVLRGQGIDPLALAGRHSNMVRIAGLAAEQAQVLIQPQVVVARFAVQGWTHQCLTLQGGATLSGELISSALAGTESVALGIVTLGSALEEAVRAQFATDPALALALDGAGNAAVNQIYDWILHELEQQALQAGLQTTLPISPGDEGWSVASGQTEIFNALQPDPAIVRLRPSALMLPIKSTSFVLGFGHVLADQKESRCERCSMRESCKFRCLEEAL